MPETQRQGQTSSVGIVILSYKRESVTSECMESLKKLDYKNFQIVLIDNSADNLTGKTIQSKYPDVTLIDPGINTGFRKGNNIGIKFCLESHFDYVLLLNDDVTVEPDFLSILINKAGSLKEEEHVLTAKILFEHDKSKIWYAGGRLSYWQGIGINYGHSKMDSPEFDLPAKVNYTTGCLMLIKSSVFNKIGLFNEKMFMYCEDVEFSIRLNAAKIPIFYVPQAKIYHKIGSGIGFKNYSPLYYYYMARNRMLITPNPLFKIYLFLFNLCLSSVKALLIMFFIKTDHKARKITALARGSLHAFYLLLWEKS